MSKFKGLFLLFLVFAVAACSGEQNEADQTAEQVQDMEETVQKAEDTPENLTAGIDNDVDYTKNVSERLKNYFQSKYGTRLPQGATVSISELESTGIGGFEKGSFVIEIPGRGEQSVPFLVSEDKIHMIIGGDDIADTGQFQDSPVVGFLQGEVRYGNTSMPVLVSNDGRHIIVGEVHDTRVDPLKQIMDGISLEDVPVKGSEDATVTIVEYSSFQCPFCKRASGMINELLEEFDGDIRVYFKQFPLPNQPWSGPAANASLCAYDQGNDSFWKMHGKIFENQSALNASNFNEKAKEFAGEIGLDKENFNNCLETGKFAQRVNTEHQEGQNLGVNSTPTFVIDGIMVPGADKDALRNAIEMRLTKK